MSVTKSRQIAIDGLRFNYQYNPDTRRITARGIAPFTASSYEAAGKEVKSAVVRHDVLSRFLSGFEGELTFPLMMPADGRCRFEARSVAVVRSIVAKSEVASEFTLLWKLDADEWDSTVTFIPVGEVCQTDLSSQSQP